MHPIGNCRFDFTISPKGCQLLFVAINRDPWIRDVMFSVMAVVMLCAALAMLASCQFPKPKSPLQAIYPPGWSPSPSNAPNTPIRAVQRANLALPAPNTTLTCDFGAGPIDGVNLWESAPNGILTLLQAYPPTNVFPVYLDQSRPHRLALTTFTRWPAPFVLSSYIDDSGNVVNTTNFYVESDPAWFIYAPTNCLSIGLFTTTNGLVLCGWNSGTNLQIDSSPDAIQWGEMTHVTSPGQFQIQVDGSQGARFWRTSKE